MSTYTLDRGLVLQTGEAQWRVQRVLDDKSVQLENQATGRIRRESISKLAADISSGKVTVVRDSDQRVEATERRVGTTVMCTASLPERYKTDFERAYSYVRYMRKLGISKGQRTRISEAISAFARECGDTLPPKASTVMQWMRTFEQSGENPASLVSRNVNRRTPKRLPDKVIRLTESILAKRYFVRDGCSLRTAHDEIVRALGNASASGMPDESVGEISQSSVRRIAQQTTPFDRDRSRLGPARARAKWRFSKPGSYAARPLERVEMDHTLLDLVVIDDKLGIPLGRPVVTLIVCAYSAYILGFFISFKGETIGRVAQCIKVAIQPKAPITVGHSLSNPWHAMGLWETLVLDNSLSFHSPHLHHIAINLCMDLEYCPVRMPWFKPGVERTLGELTRQLPAIGRPRKPGDGPDPINPSVDACVTFSDLCSGVLEWVVDVHPFEINERKMARPIDLFIDGLASCPPPTLLDDTSCLDVLAGIGSTATVDHSGIVHQWLRYTSDELGLLRRQIGSKFKANIKYDPYDLGRLFVQDPRTGGWLTVEARDQDYARGLTLTQHRLIRKAAAHKLSVANAEIVLRNARLVLQDHWSKAIQGGKRLKRSSRDLGLYQGLSSLARAAPQSSQSDAAYLRIVTDSEPSPQAAPIPVFDVFTGDTP